MLGASDSEEEDYTKEYVSEAQAVSSSAHRQPHTSSPAPSDSISQIGVRQRPTSSTPRRHEDSQQEMVQVLDEDDKSLRITAREARSSSVVSTSLTTSDKHEMGLVFALTSSMKAFSQSRSGRKRAPREIANLCFRRKMHCVSFQRQATCGYGAPADENHQGRTAQSEGSISLIPQGRNTHCRRRGVHQCCAVIL